MPAPSCLPPPDASCLPGRPLPELLTMLDPHLLMLQAPFPLPCSQTGPEVPPAKGPYQLWSLRSDSWEFLIYLNYFFLLKKKKKKTQISTKATV